jgi:hypothetical protein
LNKALGVPHQQPQQQGSRHHHVPVEGEGCGELAVEESGQGASAAAGRTRRKMKEMSPQAEIWTARQRFRGDQTEPRQRQCQGEESRYACCKLRHRLPLPQGITLRIRQLVHGDKNKIHQPPDAASAKREELKEAEPHITQVEAVYSQATYQDGEDEGHQPVLFAARQAHTTLDAHDGVRKGFLSTGLAKARPEPGTLATRYAELGVVGKLASAISTVHVVNLEKGK